MNDKELKAHDEKLIRQTWNAAIDRVRDDVTALAVQFKIHSWDPWFYRMLAKLVKDIENRKMRF